MANREKVVPEDLKYDTFLIRLKSKQTSKTFHSYMTEEQQQPPKKKKKKMSEVTSVRLGGRKKREEKKKSRCIKVIF